MNLRRFAILSSVCALAVGFLIYMFFREKTWLHMIFPIPYQSLFAKASFWTDSFVRYYLPDLLWGYAFSMALYSVFPPRGRGTGFVPALLAFSVGGVYEVLQLTAVFPGTGDAVDAFFYLCAATVAYIEIIFVSKRRMKK